MGTFEPSLIGRPLAGERMRACSAFVRSYNQPLRLTVDNKRHAMHAEAMTINNDFTILDIAKQTNECTVQYKVNKSNYKKQYRMCVE